MATALPILHATCIAGVDAAGTPFLRVNRGFSLAEISGNDLTLTLTEPIAQGESETYVTSINAVQASQIENPLQPANKRVVRLSERSGGAMFSILIVDMRSAVVAAPLPLTPVS